MIGRIFKVLIIFSLGLWSAAAGGASEGGKSFYSDSIIEDAGGRQILKQVAVIDAPVQQVWDAFATADGFRGWAAPFVHMELKVGGIIESSYQPDAKVGDTSNIKNQIVAYIPGRLLVLKNVQAPEGFAPECVMDRLVSIFEFESISAESTRLTLWGVGYGPDEESLRILEFFKEANAWTFGQLQALLTGGPGDPEGFEQFVKPSN